MQTGLVIERLRRYCYTYREFTLHLHALPHTSTQYVKCGSIIGVYRGLSV